MTYLDSIIKEYLDVPTQHAIQLTGNWGIGKTHYYENHIHKLVSRTSTIKYSDVKYKTIYVSLFGLKSVDEITSKIVYDFYMEAMFKVFRKDGLAQDEKKKLRVTSGIFKLLFTGFSILGKNESVEKMGIEIAKIAKGVLYEASLFICFDDLERLNPSLSLSELIGYINTLVDGGIKVLIICNEDVLKKDDQANYTTLKEKVISTTVNFVPDITTSIITIIDSRYKGETKFIDLLKKQLPLLEKTARTSANNLRHIIYAMDKLRTVFFAIDRDILTPEVKASEKVKEELYNISELILALSIEYKSSLISYADKDNLIRPKSLTMQELFSREMGDEQPAKKYDEIIDKYSIEPHRYQFYPSIFNYIVGAAAFDSTSFLQEVTDIFHLEHGATPEHYQFFYRLTAPDYIDIPHDEYVEMTKRLVDLAEEGQFGPSDYLSIMFCAERHGNPCDFDLDEVLGRLQNGLSNTINNAPALDSFQFLHSYSTMMSERNQKLHAEGRQLFEVAEAAQKAIHLKTTAQEFVNDPVAFNKKVSQDTNYRYQVMDIPYMNELDMNDYLEKIQQYTNSTIQYLNTIFRERYKDSGMLKKEADVLSALDGLLTKLKDKLTLQKNTIRKDLLLALAGTVHEFAQRSKDL